MTIVHFLGRILNLSVCRVQLLLVWKKKKKSNLKENRQTFVAVAKIKNANNKCKTHKKNDWILIGALFYLLKHYATLNSRYATVHYRDSVWWWAGNLVESGTLSFWEEIRELCKFYGCFFSFLSFFFFFAATKLLSS